MAPIIPQARFRLPAPKRPHISILTPVRNGSEFLRDLIESVTAQTYKNWEHVLIDDGSEDGGATVRILGDYPHLCWKSRPNRGQYATQNELLSMANGDIVTVICADDLYASRTALERVALLFEQNPGCDVVFGKTLFRVMPPPSYEFSPELPGALALRAIRYSSSIQHCSTFVRKSFLDHSGIHFDEAYRMRGDWDWMLNVFARAQHVCWTSEPLSVWRQHPNQTSKLAVQRGRQETRACCRAHKISYPAHKAIHLLTADLVGALSAMEGMRRARGLAAVVKAVSRKVTTLFH